MRDAGGFGEKLGEMLVIPFVVFVVAFFTLPGPTTDFVGWLFGRAGSETVQSIDAQLSDGSAAKPSTPGSAPVVTTTTQDLVVQMLLEDEGRERPDLELDDDPGWFPPSDERGNLAAEDDSDWWANGEYLGPPESPTPTIGGREVAAPCQPNDCEQP